MLQYRTDLAMEAHELLCAQSGAATVTARPRMTANTKNPPCRMVF